MTEILTGLGIEDHDAPVAVSIRDEEFVRTWLHEEICRAAQMSRIVAAHVDAGLTDGENVLAVPGELHHVESIARAEPDEAVVIDIDPVLLIKPGIALARTAPGLEDVALGIQFENRGCGKTTIGDRWILCGPDLLTGQARRHVNHPEVVVFVNEEPSDVAEDPVVGKGRRPRRVHFPLWRCGRCRFRGLPRRLRAARDSNEKQGCDTEKFHPISHGLGAPWANDHHAFDEDLAA